MVLTIIVLDSDENFIKYLDPDLIQITETNEEYGVRTLSVEYYVEGIEDYRNLFKKGNKIFVSGIPKTPDCLYIINTNVENDLFDKNNVVFEAEEKLVELNYIYFSQTEISSENGYTVDSKKAVTINYACLNNMFGEYFNVGIIQNCLSTYMQKINITGTMSLMELLRYIEEETGNVFHARYEKDPNKNKIHCYLDFLNPKSTNKHWELHLFYLFPTDEDNEVNNPEINEREDILEEDDIVLFPDYSYETPLNPENIQFRLNYDGEILLDEPAEDLGFTDDDDFYEFIFNYTTNSLALSVNGTETTHEVTIPHGTILEMYDTSLEKVVYSYSLYPELFEIHEDVLDLGWNVQNINYETDESETFIAIAPVINSDELTYNQLNILIQKWIDLEIEKNEVIPMIVQKRTITGTESNPCTSLNDAISRLGTYNLANNYYTRPVNPNDSTDSTNKSYEFLVGTAYWKAPFKKLEGELFVADDDVTGIEYTHIQGNQDNINECVFPKTGPVETSDEDIYSIFNDVCMKLKEKRYPEFSVEVDVANIIEGEFISYNIFDQVYIKIPGFENLILATVTKTEKNPILVGENKIELSNFSVNKKVAQKKTGISARNLSFKYPQSKKLSARLVNLEHDSEDPNSIQYLPNKLLSFTVYSVENDTQTLTGKVYTKKTDSTGYANVNIKLPPGNYEIDIQFPGDTEYASTNTTVKINVAGPTEVKTKTVKQTQKVKIYYTKNGVSPDGKTICAIGRRIAKGPFYLSVFERKCPYCGSKELYWNIFWAGNEHQSVGIFPGLAKKEKGSTYGRIFCQKCEHGWNVLGQSVLTNGKKLTVVKKAKKSSKTEAYTLKNGKKLYGTVKKDVAVEKVVGNEGSEMSRTSGNTGSTYSGLVSDKVKQKAKNIVGNSTGIPAAKKIAKWVGKTIKNEFRDGLYQTPDRTLSRKRGNDICQVDLMLQMCDAVGVTSKYAMYYIHIGESKHPNRHFFARINGVDVDPQGKFKAPWGHAAYKSRTVYARTQYPKLPITRKYVG